MRENFYEIDYCDSCEYYDDCEYADGINFCDDCKDYKNCPLKYVSCKAGYEIECNNGFEDKNDYCPNCGTKMDGKGD